jgi:hypothetical protein
MGNGTMKLTQPVLLKSFIDEFDVKTSVETSLPAKAGQVLVKGDEKDVMSDAMKTKYRSGVGKLRYLATWSRPDILNAVREVSRHLKTPTQIHYNAMKTIMEYCIATEGRGRKIAPLQKWDGTTEFEFVVSGKSDSTYNQCPETRRSVSGNTTEVNGVPVITKSIMQETMKLSVTEAELDSAVTNVQDMLFVKAIIESLGLKVKIPMILSVDNQGVRELVNNWSVGGRTRHVASKAMFLRELKEWGLVVVKYLPGALMSSDLLTKNLPGPLFVKHAANYVTDDDVAIEEAEEQQAREARGTMKSSCHKNEVEAQDEVNNVRLPSIGHHKVNQHEDEEEARMGEKRLCMDYSQLEVEEKRGNGVVMNDGKDGKDWMIGVGTVKNG